MTPRPPISTRTYTLFPSTTLFRSSGRWPSEPRDVVSARLRPVSYSAAGLCGGCGDAADQDGDFQHRNRVPFRRWISGRALRCFDLYLSISVTCRRCLLGPAIIVQSVGARIVLRLPDAQIGMALCVDPCAVRSEEHTSELQYLMP